MPTNDEKMLLLPQSLAQTLLNYLGKRPYVEVFQVIPALLQLGELVTATETPKEPEKPVEPAASTGTASPDAPIATTTDTAASPTTAEVTPVLGAVGAQSPTPVAVAS